MKNILLTAFEGTDNSSAIIAENVKLPCRKLTLPNSKEKAAELLKKALSDKSVTCVIMLGQKPAICDKIAVEPKANRSGSTLHTAMDVTVAAEIIRNSGYDAYISRGAGNSYCNHIYYECLESGVNCIFLHVPCVNRISDMKKITSAIEALIEQIGGVPAAL